MQKRAELFEQAISSVLGRIIQASDNRDCAVLSVALRDLLVAENLFLSGEEGMIDDDDGYTTEFCGD